MRLLVLTARSLPMKAVTGAALAAAAPTVLTELKGGDDLTVAVVVAVIVAAAGLGYAVEDAAGVTIAASPTTLGRRRLVRGLIVASVLSLGWALVAILATVTGDGDATTRTLLVEALTASGVAVGVAAAVDREGRSQAGLAGLAAGVMTMLFVTVFSSRWFWLPRLGGGEGHARWLWLAAAGWALALWSSRDPARRAVSLPYRAGSAAGGARPHSP